MLLVYAVLHLPKLVSFHPVFSGLESACDMLIVIAMMTTLEGAGSRSRMAPTCEERETFGKAEDQLFTGTALYLYLASYRS